MNDCIKNLFCKQPDVILSAKNPHAAGGVTNVVLARSRRLGSRRIVERNGDTILLNDDGTVSGGYSFTHWEAV